MGNKITGSESATGFAIPGDEKYGWMPESIPGLTIRQKFAIDCISGFDSMPDNIKAEICGEDAPYYLSEDLDGGMFRVNTYGEPYVAWLLKGRSRFAVMQADALINALNEDNESHTP